MSRIRIRIVRIRNRNTKIVNLTCSKIMQEEGTLSEARQLELETRLQKAEEEKTALSKERADNIFQLKQMNRFVCNFCNMYLEPRCIWHTIHTFVHRR